MCRSAGGQVYDKCGLEPDEQLWSFQALESQSWSSGDHKAYCKPNGATFDTLLALCLAHGAKDVAAAISRFKIPGDPRPTTVHCTLIASLLRSVTLLVFTLVVCAIYVVGKPKKKADTQKPES